MIFQQTVIFKRKIDTIINIPRIGDNVTVIKNEEIIVNVHKILWNYNLTMVTIYLR
jgi:hypothetical protein